MDFVERARLPGRPHRVWREGLPGVFAKTYAEVDALNRVYHHRYKNFQEAAADHFQAGEAAAFSPYPERLDRLRFAVDSLAQKLAEIGAQVKQIDRQHLVHVNPHNVSQCIMPSGQSVWAEARVVDFLGCSTHPSWHSWRFPAGRLHQSVALFADLMHGATRARMGSFG